MTSLQIDQTPNSAILTLATKLFLTWICSLLWGLGIFVFALSFRAATVAGLINYFGPPTWNTQSTYMLIVGSVAIFCSPLFLGAFFAHSWLKGFTSGLCAVFMAVIGFFLFYELAGFLYVTFSGHLVLFYSLLSAVPAALAIIAVLLWNRLPQPPLGIASGLIIGFGITLVNGVILGQNLLVSTNIFHLLWQVPPLIWVSIIYYLEMPTTRSKPAGFLIWFLLTLTTFILPFLVVPLFFLQ